MSWHTQLGLHPARRPLSKASGQAGHVILQSNINTVGPPYHYFCDHGFNQLQIQNIKKNNNSRKFQKAKLEFASHPTFYISIYIAF